MTISIDKEQMPLSVSSEGIIYIANTRVTLDTLLYTFFDGATAEQIVEQYPSLDLADVYAAIGYYLHHNSQIDAYLKERAKVATKIKDQIDKKSTIQGIRKRLLSRKKKNRK